MVKIGTFHTGSYDVQKTQQENTEGTKQKRDLPSPFSNAKNSLSATGTRAFAFAKAVTFGSMLHGAQLTKTVTDFVATQKEKAASPRAATTHLKLGHLNTHNKKNIDPNSPQGHRLQAFNILNSEKNGESQFPGVQEAVVLHVETLMQDIQTAPTSAYVPQCLEQMGLNTPPEGYTETNFKTHMTETLVQQMAKGHVLNQTKRILEDMPGMKVDEGILASMATSKTSQLEGLAKATTAQEVQTQCEVIITDIITQAKNTHCYQEAKVDALSTAKTAVQSKTGMSDPETDRHPAIKSLKQDLMSAAEDLEKSKTSGSSSTPTLSFEDYKSAFEPSLQKALKAIG